jgi:hypothetical protein
LCLAQREAVHLAGPSRFGGSFSRFGLGLIAQGWQFSQGHSASAEHESRN